ncbi:alpha/beta hydrolase [Oceanobacillus sp. J11TS1]|uniref:alpha/beta hydrolase n=1 Tax=Oceanobacillus sp. J11TS1 TaxID=2807191 RepID=UPI001B291D18|nr:alpha/beta hydrolase [Oceanobacillus sp. J11TS1]GIO23335.1 phospholipase/carboxylesterase [Oceanobacillus sp. J11TS1]
MQYIYEEKGNPNGPTLLLLHGTGGTENDLLPLANIIDPNANVLSVRGNVLENGMPRFFRRLEEGVFDEEDLIKRTQELHEFLNEASQRNGFDRKQITAIGYSNGANIAGSLLFHYENSLQKAILHHPMIPRRGIKLPNLTGTDVFIAAGENDPICSPEEAEELTQLLKNAGAHVDIHWESNGHQLSMREIKAASVWYAASKA